MRIFIYLGAILGCLFAMLVLAATLYFNPTLPSVQVLREAKLQIPLRLYTRDGKLIGSFGEKRRQQLRFDEIPAQFTQALLAAEDAGFEGHYGVDIKGLARAVYELTIYGEKRSGGSTITMQVARNYLLTRERSFARKFREILLALKMETDLDKEEILELYVNQIFLGHRAYGIAAAAEVYYGKDIKDLTLAQLATIAALPKAPSTLNPLTNPVRAKARRNWILGRMLELGNIDADQHRQAFTSPITAAWHSTNTEIDAPHVAEHLRRKILKFVSLDAYTEGYRIYTTLDSTMQQAAVEAVRQGLLGYDRRHGFRQPENHVNLLDEDTLRYFLDKVDQGEDILKLREELQLYGTLQIPEAVERVQELLSVQPRYRDRRVALVLRVAEEGGSANILLANQEVVSISWSDDLRWARLAQSVDNMGPRPNSLTDILQTGDLIYVAGQGENWVLTQAPEAEAALVSMDARTGAIRALVGGFDYTQSSYNRAYQAQPQVGSNIKPFIYATALSRGYTPASRINDAPVAFEDKALERTWRPENSGGIFFGLTRLREALINSRNLVSVRLLQGLGINRTLQYISKFGFDTQRMPRDLSLALGSPGLAPVELVRGYAVFANGGFLIEPHLIERIEDESGQVVMRPLYSRACKDCSEQPEPEIDPALLEYGLDDKPLSLPNQLAPVAPRVIDERIAYIMWDFLRDAIQRGTGRRAKVLGRKDIAGKTATTNDASDTWFTGFNSELVSTVWVGFDQPRSLGKNEWGNTTALPIWITYNETALNYTPEQRPQIPVGLVRVNIDRKSGQRAARGSKGSMWEWFLAEHTPEILVGQTEKEEHEITPEDLF